MEKALRDKKAILFFITPALAWFLGIVLIPLIQSCYYSFLSWNGMTEARWVGLANYRIMFSDPVFWKGVGNALILGAASTFIQIPLAMILALTLASGVRGERLYLTIFFIPVLISSTIIAELWTKVYHPKYGLLNHLLNAVGLSDWKRSWLGDPETALVACFVPPIWQAIGYHMLLLYSAIKSISPDILDAAKVDGANNFQLSVRVILPQITSIIRACVIFAVIGSLKSFDFIYILTYGGPNNATTVPALHMYIDFVSNRTYGKASSTAVFLIAGCMLMTLIIQRVFRRFEQ